MKKSIELKRFEIRLSGTGGQGILTLGAIMGRALAPAQKHHDDSRQQEQDQKRLDRQRDGEAYEAVPVASIARALALPGDHGNFRRSRRHFA